MPRKSGSTTKQGFVLCFNGKVIRIPWPNLIVRGNRHRVRVSIGILAATIHQRCFFPAVRRPPFFRDQCPKARETQIRRTRLEATNHGVGRRVCLIGIGVKHPLMPKTGPTSSPTVASLLAPFPFGGNRRTIVRERLASRQHESRVVLSRDFPIARGGCFGKQRIDHAVAAPFESRGLVETREYVE